MTTPRPFRSALFACLLSTFAALPAQDPVTPPAGSQAAAAAAPNLSFVFQGGTFGELCTQLREGVPSHVSVNIVIELEAAKAVLPQFQVQDAGLAQVLEAACATARSEDCVLHVKELRGSGSPVFAIVARPQSQPAGANAAAAAARVVTAVHSLGALLKDGRRDFGFTPETILSAIETATGELPLRALRYHTDSRLLIARGTQENLSVVADVLRELESDVRRQEQQRKAAESHPGGGAGKASADQPKAGAAKDQAETR